MAHSGLLVDYGGVLTTSLFGSFESFCRGEGLDPKSVREIFRGDEEAVRLLIDFECGRVEEAHFERILAGRLGVEPEGLIDRLFAGMAMEEAMVEAVASAKLAGIRTGLLSNSWGTRYDRTRWDELFDVLVISGEEGIRKPEPAIYELAADRLGLPPDEIVFVDDLPHNLEPARDLGMATVHHKEPESTLLDLERLLGIPLGPPGPVLSPS